MEDVHAPYLSADWSTDVLGTIKRGELFKDTNLSMCFDRVSHCSQIYVRNWHKRSALQLLPLGRRLAMMLVATISAIIFFIFSVVYFSHGVSARIKKPMVRPISRPCGSFWAPWWPFWIWQVVHHWRR